MEKVKLHFQGKHFDGSIVLSKEETPFFYWCFIDDLELAKDIGDCIGFKDDGNRLEPTEIYPRKYKALVDQAMYRILQFLYKA